MRFALCPMFIGEFSMAEKSIKVSVFRFDPSVDPEPHYQTYQVPFEKGMSAMSALDYIYQNLDSTLAYYERDERHERPGLHLSEPGQHPCLLRPCGM
jgi:hypothetical protein